MTGAGFPVYKGVLSYKGALINFSLMRLEGAG